MKKNKPTLLGQKGLVHLSPLILIAAVGVIAFILLAASGDFQNSIFAKIFPKEVTEAARRIIPPWWRKWRPPPSPTPSPTPIPTSTPASTPTPAPSGAPSTFPIGIGLRTSELEWWNQRALSTDQLIGVPPSLTPVSSARGVRVMFTIASDPASSMDTAKTNGWMVSANIEDPNVDTVIGGGISSGSDTNPAGSTIIGEIDQYKMAKDRGLTFIFGPTGRMLENDWDYTYKGQDHALLRNADIMIYQTQRYQDDSRKTLADYATTVKDLIGNIRPYLAKKQVWVQVSANPPANRCTTAAKVIEYIDSIMDGSANSPDAIHIFVSAQYDSQCSEKRVDVMKQIVDHYR